MAQILNHCSICGTAPLPKGGNTICRNCADKVNWKDYRQIPADGLSCPKCGQAARRGGFAAWQIVICIIFFPFGFLSLLAGRQPSECPKCNFRW